MKYTILTGIMLGLSYIGGAQTAPHGEGGANSPLLHKIKIFESIPTANYTYLHVKENGSAKWLAVPTMTVDTNATYYYAGNGLVMPDFESKELHRKFDKVIFLGKVMLEPGEEMDQNPHAGGTASASKKNTKTEVKKDIKIEPVNGGLTVGQLYAQKASFEGKTVKVKGQVTKYSAQILGKNWVHLQDGTDFNGKFDLIVTTTAEVKTGDVVCWEGKISLDKDLGYGYKFDVIMEEAKINK